MTDTNSTPHQIGQRVRCAFDQREGIVVESNPRSTLIEFEEYDPVERELYKHRKWLPTRHWIAIPTDPETTGGGNG